jgi:hypothetical protein
VRYDLERRLLIVVLFLLTAGLVIVFADDRSSKDDFWLAGICVSYGVVLGRLFWQPAPPDSVARGVDTWRTEPLPPPRGDSALEIPQTTREHPTAELERTEVTEVTERWPVPERGPEED